MSEDGRGDDYESRYMSDDGGALYRERVLPPSWYHLLFAGPAAVLLSAVALSPAPLWSALPGVLVLATSWGLLSVLRVVVTGAAVHVQLGPFGPRIPTRAIESVEKIRTRPVVHGWGIHRLLDGTWAYTLPGRHGVRIRWRDEQGKRRTTVVTSPHPDVLVDAIERARRGEVGDVAREEPVDLAAARAGHGVVQAPAALEEVEAEVEHAAQRRPRGGS